MVGRTWFAHIEDNYNLTGNTSTKRSSMVGSRALRQVNEQMGAILPSFDTH